jgi:hypothetical protein
VKPTRIVGEYQVRHSRVSLFLARLTKEKHHYDPLDLLDIDIGVIQRQKPIYHQFSLRRRENADLLQMQQIPPAGRIQPFLLEAVEDSYSG